MKSFCILTLLLLSCLLGATDPVGKWTFNNSTDLLNADMGNDLALVGTHQAVAGPAADNGAVRIGPGSFYRCYHDIAANGGGTWVNEYSLLIDFKVPSIGQWYCFFQTNYQNTNDGEAFVNTSGQVGVAATGYSSYLLVPNEWYRMVISADLGSSYKYYLDGQLLQDGGVQAADGRFAIYPQANQNQVLFFADENGEDNLLDVAEVRLYNVPLTGTEATSLGGYGHNVNSGPAAMLPFLQSPTPNSIYISWHDALSTQSIVNFGTTQALGQTASGTTYTFNASTLWHTVKLEGLEPDTKYYYRCQTDVDMSEMRSFNTPPENPASGHYRFVIVSDSQSNITTSTHIVAKIAEKCEELFGTDWQDELDLVCHAGDIMGNGGSLGTYPTEFFVPFSQLSGYVPIMISIGNHEGESSYYYNYMKYEDFGGPEGEKYYSLDLAGMRFLFLNPHIGTTQEYPWLVQKVSEADDDPSIHHIFAFDHMPGHSEVWPDGNNSWTQNTVIPTLDGSSKSAILASGHSHNYEHSTSRSGLSHLRRLICGGAGGSLDRWGMYANQTNYPEVHKSLDQYHWVLVDVDLSDYSYTAKVFSMGNTDFPRDNELADSWSYNPNGEIPEQPWILGTATLSGNRVQVTLSPFSDASEEFFSIGGEISATESFSSTLSSVFTDAEDYYGDSGSPFYLPINLNADMDRRRIIFNAQGLTTGSNYWLRSWYRDTNLDKSVSEPIIFTNFAYDPFCDFHADAQTALTGELVQFVDLSGGDISAWAWDFDSNGTTDSNQRDPVYGYFQPGVYDVSLSIETEQGTRFMSKEDFIQVNPTAVDDPLQPDALIRDLRNYPNPFSQMNTVVFELKDSAQVKLDIFNSKGQLVRTLLDANKAAGQHQLNWNGLDDSGTAAASGVYFYRLRAGDESSTGKMLLLK